VVYCCTDVTTRGVVLVSGFVRIDELCAALDSAGALVLGAGAGVVLGTSALDTGVEDAGAGAEDSGAEVAGADDCSSLGDGVGVGSSAADEGSGVALGTGVLVVAGTVSPVPLAWRLFPLWR
jgi:hypothetical protein